MTTVPLPLAANTRSMKSRGRWWLLDGALCCTSRSSAAMNPLRPSPVDALSGRIGASCKKVPTTWSAISMLASSRSSASHKSILVRAMIPCLTPTSCKMRKCSSVCGFHPSWPSTTKMHALIPPTPANILPMNRVCPGTSMNATLSPLGNSM